MDQQVHATAPSAERDALLDVIRPGQDATVAERVGMFEIIELETAVEKAVADGLIDPAELADIRRIYAEITAD